jgi:hypothetical protein
MNLLDFVEPVSLEKPDEHLIASPNLIGKTITIHTPDNVPANFQDFQIAILGVPEDRNSFNRGASLAPEKIRAQLYNCIV